MDQKLKIFIILGSTREGRFSEKPGKWMLEEAKKRPELDAEILDLRDYPLPFFNSAVSPSRLDSKYTDPVALKWVQKLAEADGFIFISPEYNHGYTAVLKNAIDYGYKEWHRKPAAFIGYGSVGGARSIEQLREVVIELQMAPVRSAVHIPGQSYMAILQDQPDAFKPLEDAKNLLLDDLTWWGNALKTARNK